MGEIALSKGHVLSTAGGCWSISALLQEQMCFLGQQLVFEESANSFERLLGVKVNAKQIERVCHHYGEELERRQEQLIQQGGQDDRHSTSEKCYAMLDGGMVLTREEKWKEMKLGRIFDPIDHVHLNKNRQHIGQSTYVAHLGGHRDFLQKMEYHLDTKGSVIFIADGARWIWKWVESMYPESTQILDFFHAKEHLCQWAALVITDEQERTDWINEQTLRLLNDRVLSVIENIQRIKVYKPKIKNAKNALIEYYTINQHRMKYRTFKENGWMIGSGPIEAAHRHVIQQRMKLSGQRWTKKGAQQIANLRALNKSNQWDNVVQLISLAA